MTRLLTTRHLLTEHSNPKTAPPPEAATMESDFVLILAALLCGLICLVGLAAMLRCAWLRQALTRSSTAANKGLKKKVLQTLPKYTYGSSILPQLEENDNSSSNNNNNNNNNNNSSNVGFKFACTSTECPICLGEFVEGDQLRVLPRCGHGFHVVCIDTWLGSHSSCPSCRQILVVARCHKCGHNALGTGNNCNNNNNNNNSFLP